MNEGTLPISTQLHELEDLLIQINGLVEALQQIQPDDGASACVLNIIEEKIGLLQSAFYKHWERVFENLNH